VKCDLKPEFKGNQLWFFAAVCPHMGCAVKWNPKDTTFDCPCHGSQFDTDGVCIQGPGKAGLEKLAPNQNQTVVT